MNSAGRTGPGIFTFHVNVMEVRQGFLDRNICGETDDLATRPQWSKMKTFNKGSGLPLRVSFMVMRESLNKTYGGPAWSGLHRGHYGCLSNTGIRKSSRGEIRGQCKRREGKGPFYTCACFYPLKAT